MAPSSVFLQHDLGRLDHNFDRVAFLERHLLGALAGDNAFDEVVAYANCNVSHYATKLKFLDVSFELIASRKCHNPRLNHERLAGKWPVVVG